MCMVHCIYIYIYMQYMGYFAVSIRAALGYKLSFISRIGDIHVY